MVNLHTAPGVGNGMGAIFNAQANKSPLLVTAGQQARSLMTLQANLTNRDATRMPHPLVKWSYEPPRAEDVPHALARGAHLASLPPRGPVFVSIPMDDWARRGGPAWPRRTSWSARWRPGRRPDPGGGPRAGRAPGGRRAIPVLVAGPELDSRRRLGRGRGAGRAAAPAGLGHPRHGRRPARLPRGPSRVPGHPAAGRGPRWRRRSPGTTSSSWPGRRCSPTTRTSPGPPLPEGASLVAITSDPDEAARAPMGDALVADPALTLEALLARARASPSARPPPERPAPEAAAGVRSDEPLGGGGRAGRACSRMTASWCSSRRRARSRCATGCGSSRPGSYYFGAGGGLGFGLAAAIGVQLAQPERPVVCVLGEGSAQYAIQGFWTAAAYGVPVTFLVLRNEEYAILKWFASLEAVTGAPGLDLPALDVAAVAAGYGVRARSGWRRATSCTQRSATPSPPTGPRSWRYAWRRAWRSASGPASRGPSGARAVDDRSAVASCGFPARPSSSSARSRMLASPRWPGSESDSGRARSPLPSSATAQLHAAVVAAERDLRPVDAPA